MGEFSVAFNRMIGQLAERERDLKDQLFDIQTKKTSLEQSNLLLTVLMHYVPQQIIVVDKHTREVLLMNDIAINEVHNDPDYVSYLIKSMDTQKTKDLMLEVEITYRKGNHEHFLMVRTYSLEWNNRSAEIFVVSDITATKNKIVELEHHAYKDNITQLYNRTFGMLTLDSWLHDKRQFALIFADLDSLKYVNDVFGHYEGDMYIVNAAKHLKTFSPDAVVCRIGGDEFMLLAPEMDHDEALMTMNGLFINFQRDEYLKDKAFSYSISFGIVAVGRDNMLSACDILSKADERMYEHKRLRKKARQQTAQPA
jgi:diguanylate cyclase (GGDEF)-like protein